jgi:signal transduction histidine kinase
MTAGPVRDETREKGMGRAGPAIAAEDFGLMDRRRHTLLIVDDEPDVLDSLRHLFHRHYVVRTATSAREALELLQVERDNIHLILSDQRMPGMTGDEFLARSREIAPDAIRLLFTGYADIQAVSNAINKGGIFRYILKPWDAADLENTLRQAAEQYELLAERRRLLKELQEANAQLIHANTQLEEADQLKTAFLEVASHELNTPITIVQGLAELLQFMEPNRSVAEQEILRQLTDGTRQLARLVANMLKLQAAGDYRNALQTEPTDLAGLLRQAIGRVQPFLSARRMTVQDEIADNLGQFEVDFDKLTDAFLNLLTNAIKFTPDAGRITVAASLVAPDEAEIVVADQGIGLEPRALARLFSPFFTEFDPRHHSSGEYEFGRRGLGLGLYLVKTFVELHGGRVAATSAPGEGTRVTIRLPRYPLRSAEGRLQYESVDSRPGSPPDDPKGVAVDPGVS